MDENPLEGFLRALSIVCRQPMPSSSIFQTNEMGDCEETNTGTSPTAEKVNRMCICESFALSEYMYIFNDRQFNFSSICVNQI